MLWVYIIAAATFALAAAVVGGRKRKGALGTTHRFIVKLSGSAAANAVPVGHVVLLVFFLTLFDKNCLPLVTSHTYRSILRCHYPLPALVLARIYFSNPGKITRANHSNAVFMFPFDRILFYPQKECSTCGFEKPARSKHCSSCRSCIALADHHCLWVNNCVGLLNARWFLLFLVVHIYFFAHAIVILTVMVWSAFSLQWSQGKRWLTLFWSVVGMGRAYCTACCLLILSVNIGFLCTAFFALHLRYIYQGCTTNEVDKWDDVTYLIGCGDLYVYEGTSIVLQKLQNGQWNRPLAKDEMAVINDQRLVKVRGWSDIINIYDQGFWNNLMLLLNPPHF